MSREWPGTLWVGQYFAAIESDPGERDGIVHVEVVPVVSHDFDPPLLSSYYGPSPHYSVPARPGGPELLDPTTWFFGPRLVRDLATARRRAVQRAIKLDAERRALMVEIEETPDPEIEIGEPTGDLRDLDSVDEVELRVNGQDFDDLAYVLGRDLAAQVLERVVRRVAGESASGDDGDDEPRISGGTLDDYRTEARATLQGREGAEMDPEWWAGTVLALCDEIERLRDEGDDAPGGRPRPPGSKDPGMVERESGREDR